MDQTDRKKRAADRKGKVGAVDEHKLQAQLDRIKREERAIERAAADDAGLLDAKAEAKRKGIKPLELGTPESRAKLEKFEREHNRQK